MNINWPPEETIDYEAKNPTKENGIVINALPGVNKNKGKSNKVKDEGMNKQFYKRKGD